MLVMPLAAVQSHDVIGVRVREEDGIDQVVIVAL